MIATGEDHKRESEADAYQLTSQLATIRVAQMVDPTYTVAAKFPKKHLPPKVPRNTGK